MARRVSFWVTRKVPKRVNVRFRTYDGRIVRFQAIKRIPVRKRVSFWAKGRRRW